MIYLLDTNAFADLMRELPSAIGHVDGLADDDQIVICSIVRGEILYGIERLSAGKRKDDLRTKASILFAAIACEVVPSGAADFYAAVKLSRAAKGLTMDENDLWIAATAMCLGANLVSRDNDVKNVDGLVVVDWSK
jgi:predicted nucleic acid-binding protein